MTQPDHEIKYLYRYYEVSYTHGPQIREEKIVVYRPTPKGFRVYGEKGKWVPNYGRKRYAYPTKEEAWRSYRARKLRHAKILRGQLADVEGILETIKAQSGPPDIKYLRCKRKSRPIGSLKELFEPKLAREET